jgi:DNA-directed RNA polymerase specialized sigma24 family protein
MEQTLTLWQGAFAVYEAEPLLTFEQLYVREYPGLMAVAWVLAGRREDGEDLVHDTMVQALTRWKYVGALERPGGWCHHVLVNRCRSWFRRHEHVAAGHRPAVPVVSDFTMHNLRDRNQA